MTRASETRLIIPGLSAFYAAAEPMAYTITRVAVGAIIFVHGWGKITGGAARVVDAFTRMGLPAPSLLAYCAMFLETVGAACLVIGLFTRFFAAALAVEMLIALIAVHGPKGFGVSTGGYEYVLLLGITFFFVAIRGGGPYSVDAKIGKEL